MPNPVANFTWAVTGDKQVTFTDTSTCDVGATIASWSWDFGDTGTDTVQNPAHTYGSLAGFSATLTVTDSNALTGSVTLPVTSYAALVALTAGLSGVPDAVLQAAANLVGQADGVSAVLDAATADLTFLNPGVADGISGAGGVLTAFNPTYLTVTSLLTSGDGFVSGFGVWVQVESSAFPVQMVVNFRGERRTYSIPDGQFYLCGVFPLAGEFPVGNWPAGLIWPGSVDLSNADGVRVTQSFTTNINTGPLFRYEEVSSYKIGFARVGGDFSSAPTAFDWDFGDGSLHETTEVPAGFHDYPFGVATTYTVSYSATLEAYTNVGAGDVLLVSAAISGPRVFTKTSIITVTGTDPGVTPYLHDYGHEDTDAARVSAFELGWNTAKVRGLYPIPGNRLLVVTELGAFLYNISTQTLINQIRISNRESSLTSFSEWFGEMEATWTSECCAAPFFHVNVNLLADGRVSPFGFIVVRRTADEVVSENRGGSLVTRTYAHWAIHFDPIDLSAPGPIVGEFHFLKDGTLTPDELLPQEVTWLDGCSTNAWVADHQDGYAPDLYKGDVHQIAIQPVDPLKGAGYPKDGRPNRFFDSYIAFRVLIDVGTQFRYAGKGWDETPRSPDLPRPKSLSAYLIFANGGSRGPLDPPLKLMRIHYPSFAHLARMDADGGDGSTVSFDHVPGSWVPYEIQWNRLPIGIPYLPNRYFQIGKNAATNLWAGNFLYSNLYPQLFGADGKPGSLVHNKFLWATQQVTDSRYLPAHGDWPEQIWVTWDVAVEEHGTFDDVESWGYPWWSTYTQRRKDALGSQAIRFFEIVPEGKAWIPGPFTSIQMSMGSWDFTPGQRIVVDNSGGVSPNPSLYKRFQVATRAFVAAGYTEQDRRTYLPYIAVNGGLDGTPRSPARYPWLSQNPLRGWESNRLLYSTADGLGRFRRFATLGCLPNVPGPFYWGVTDDGLVERTSVSWADPVEGAV